MEARRFTIGIGLLLALSLISLVCNTRFIDSLVLFLLLGIIPGTTISVPVWGMLILLALLAFAAISWIRHQPLYIGNLAAQEQVARKVARDKIHRQAAARRSDNARRQRRKARPASA